MVNLEIKKSKSLVYLSDNSKKRFGKSRKALTECVEAFLQEAERFIHSKKQIGTNWPKSVGIELSVTLCGNQKIKRLNHEFRNKNKATDVLSFPQQESLREQTGAIYFGNKISLGDIVICRDVTASQAKSFKISYEQELIHLMVHGFLHLCGFDHEISEIEEKIMFKLEKQLVKKIYKNLGYE